VMPKNSAASPTLISFIETYCPGQDGFLRRMTAHALTLMTLPEVQAG
jgi:hypothetical protein